MVCGEIELECWRSGERVCGCVSQGMLMQRALEREWWGSCGRCELAGKVLSLIHI